MLWKWIKALEESRLGEGLIWEWQMGFWRCHVRNGQRGAEVKVAVLSSSGPAEVSRDLSGDGFDAEKTQCETPAALRVLLDSFCDDAKGVPKDARPPLAVGYDEIKRDFYERRRAKEPPPPAHEPQPNIPTDTGRQRYPDGFYDKDPSDPGDEGVACTCAPECEEPCSGYMGRPPCECVACGH